MKSMKLPFSLFNDCFSLFVKGPLPSKFGIQIFRVDLRDFLYMVFVADYS